MRGRRPPEFKVRLMVYSVSFLGRPELEYGNKILLPPSALDQLARLSIVYPMLFELTNPNAPDSVSHAGVLEFVAEEGRCYVPWWLMQSLLLSEGSIITVRNVSLPLGSFVKFKPQSTAFLDISNPKAVLENALRNFATLTQDNIIKINYNDRDYELAVEEVAPITDASRGGICVIETDMQVDFSPPVGYVDPSPSASTTASSTTSTTTSSSSAPPPSSSSSAGGLIFGAPTAGGDGSSSSSSYSDSEDDDNKSSYWDNLGSGKSLRASSTSTSTSTSTSSSAKAAEEGGDDKNLSIRDRRAPLSVPKGFEPFSGTGNSLR